MEEQVKRLSPYEGILIRAAEKSYYGYPDSRTRKELAGIYGDITGGKSPGCSSCGASRWIARLGVWYKDSIKKKNNDEGAI